MIVFQRGKSTGMRFYFFKGSYVVDGVLMGYKSLISNEEQIFKRCARF